jgi:hypothetical protein
MIPHEGPEGHPEGQPVHEPAQDPEREPEPEHESEVEPARSTLDHALATGALVAITTGGALIGIGLRDGEPGRVFRLVGRTLLERMGVASASAPLTSVTLGYLHHLVIATGWGIALGFLLLSLRGHWRYAGAPVVAALYALLALYVVTPVLRIGYSVTSSPPSVVSIAVVLTLALLGGAWLASSDPHRRG